MSKIHVHFNVDAAYSRLRPASYPLLEGWNILLQKFYHTVA